MTPYTPSELLLGRKLKRAGIVNPLWTIRASKKAGLPLDLACAFLEQESGGGHNVFGHDPTIYSGAGAVTEARYRAYKARRGPTGRGGMQGVGPMQLTWYSYQDDADRLGGCWKPYPNMLVGFRYAAANIKRYGLHAGIAAYNGSGPAAQSYADSVLRLRSVWARRV